MKRFKLHNGSNLVEFALVLPFLLVLMFGIIDASLALYNKAVVTNASREGARAGVVTKVPPLSNLDITQVVERYCNNYLITFGGSKIPTVTIDRTGGTSPGDPLKVSVGFSYNYAVINKLVPLGMGSLNLKAVTVMRLE